MKDLFINFVIYIQKINELGVIYGKLLQ